MTLFVVIAWRFLLLTQNIYDFSGHLYYDYVKRIYLQHTSY